MSSSTRDRNTKKLKKKSTSKPLANPKKEARLTSQKNNPKLKSSNCSSKHVKPPSSKVESVKSNRIKWDQEKPREWEDRDYSKMPYEAPNEVNFIGGLGTNIGHHRSKKFINRPTRVQEIFNMTTDNNPIFSFCEDPREANNVPPRKLVHMNDDDKEFFKNAVHKLVEIKHEQCPEMIEEAIPSICGDVPQSDTDSNIEQIEVNKRQNYEFRKQFLTQSRALKKAHIESQLPVDLGFEDRKEYFKISKYFDINKNIPEDEDIESVREVVVDWTEKYKVESHICDLKFARPMPEAIPMHLKREKLAFVTRTLDKPRNAEILNRELQEFSKKIEKSALEDIKSRNTTRELEKMLTKQRAENLPIEIAVKDFDEYMEASGVFPVEIESNKDAESIISDDTKRRKQLDIAIEEFREKIAQRFSESHDAKDDTDSVINLSKSYISSRFDEMFDSNRKTDEDNRMPVDFTYAFDTKLNKKLKKFARAEDKFVSKVEHNEDSMPNTSNASVGNACKLNIRSTEIRTTSNDHTGLLSIEQMKLSGERKEKSNDKSNGTDIKHKTSFCTNFTDDSGTFILVQDDTLHFDHLKTTKETSDQNLKLFNGFDEYLRPYEVLPLTEAKKLQKRDTKLVPVFDIKERLKVDIPRFESELIGTKENKYLSHLATEWDEYYQKEILNRPRIRRFKPRTIMKQICDSLRLKYESIYKREYLTEKSIIIEQEKLFTKRAEQFRDACMSFFSNLQTTNYRQSMAKIQDLRPMYELNDQLTTELTTVSNKLIQLKTAIIRTEGKMREATILQNVSYLMKDPNWREKNDWIHKRSDGSFETIKESIEKRMTTNLRKRDNDNVWIIKEFFEEIIFTNRRPALVAFASPSEINETIANFKIQLYLSLLKLDLSTWTLMNLRQAYKKYCKWSSEFIDQRKKYVEARCARKYFQEDCAENLKKNAVELIDGKLVETISEKTLRTLEPLCNVVYLSVIPKNIQEQLEGGSMLEKFRLIIAHAMNMLEQLDAIPSIERKEVEKKIRKENGFIQRRTKRAVDLETHIEKVKKVMIKHSTPPFKRPPRIGKLSRSFLTKPKPIAESIHADDDEVETVGLTLTERDFETFVKESSQPNDFYLDATFFGGDAEIPNIDFLPEMKSNIDEFVVDVKNVLAKWEQHKQGRYLEDAHLAWKSKFR